MPNDEDKKQVYDVPNYPGIRHTPLTLEEIKRAEEEAKGTNPSNFSRHSFPAPATTDLQTEKDKKEDGDDDFF